MQQISSQELLSHLQRKSMNNKSKIPKSIINELDSDFLDENLPPTRIKEFLCITNSQLKKSKNSKNNTNNNNKDSQIFQEKKNVLNDFKTKQTGSKNKIKKEEFTTPSFSYDTNKTKTFINDNNNTENINNENLSYLDFNLHENIYKNSDNDDPLHTYLPKKYKDNETYKENLLKFLKYENNHNRKNCNNKSYKTQKENENSLLNKICDKNNLIFFKQEQEKMKKSCSSIKKKSINKIIFFQKNKEVDFSLYKDTDIGLDQNWQIPIIYQEEDNDVESDDEQVNAGRNKMTYDIRQAIIKWSNHKHSYSCWNYRYINNK